MQTCATYKQFRLAQVARITQRAQRGTLAWLRWHGSDQWQDAWLEGASPPRGAWAVVSGADGYGPHTHNPRIFYVHEVHDVIVL